MTKHAGKQIRQSKAENQFLLGDQAPIIVLSKPQLAENIGMVARAMANCQLGELRLVAPKYGWPQPDAYKSAAGADLIIDSVKVFDDLGAALHDVHVAYATTARGRGLNMPVMELGGAIESMLEKQHKKGEKTAIVFGCERVGLSNDEVSLCDTILTIPLNPAFASLNLAQAVLLVAHHWHSQAQHAKHLTNKTPYSKKADKAALTNFYDRLEGMLEDAEFFPTAEKRPALMRRIRTIFGRTQLNQEELNLLHGIVRVLSEKRRQRF